MINHNSLKTQSSGDVSSPQRDRSKVVLPAVFDVPTALTCNL